MRISKSIKKFQRKTPGGRTTVHFRKKKLGYALCNKCGAKLNTGRLSPKKLSKVQRRPERPFPNLCSKCMREIFREMVRK